MYPGIAALTLWCSTGARDGHTDRARRRSIASLKSTYVCSSLRVLTRRRKKNRRRVPETHRGELAFDHLGTTAITHDGPKGILSRLLLQAQARGNAIEQRTSLVLGEREREVTKGSRRSMHSCRHHTLPAGRTTRSLPLWTRTRASRSENSLLIPKSPRLHVSESSGHFSPAEVIRHGTHPRGKKLITSPTVPLDEFRIERHASLKYRSPRDPGRRRARKAPRSRADDLPGLPRPRRDEPVRHLPHARSAARARYPLRPSRSRSVESMRHRTPRGGLRSTGCRSHQRRSSVVYRSQGRSPARSRRPRRSPAASIR